MTLDIKQIRDDFIALAKERGCRIEEQSPARGYTFSADIFVGPDRVGRLLMRKTTISWKAKGAKKLRRLNTRRDIDEIIDSVAESPRAKAPTRPAPPSTPAGRVKKTPSAKEKPAPPEPPKPEEPREPVEPRKPEEPGKPAKPGEPEMPEEPGRPTKEKPGEESPSREPGVTTRVVKPPTSPPRQTNSLARAVSMFKEGDFKKALDWAKLALAENPESAAAKDILERAQRLLEPKAAKPVDEKEPTEEAKEPTTVATPPEERTAKATIPEKEEPPPPKAPPSAQPPPPRPPASPEKEPESSRRRLSPWVVVALMAAILGIIIFKPPSGERATPEQTPEEVSVDRVVDPLALLWEKTVRLRRIVDTDTVGEPAEELISVLTEIAERDPGDTTAFLMLQELAVRADSLGSRGVRANRFSLAHSFLDEGLVAWKELQQRDPADSLLVDRIEWNRRTRDILNARQNAFASMVFVPADTFLMGSNAAGFDARPEREIELSAFWTDKFEVTNRAYQAFLIDTETDGPTDRRSSYKPYSWTGSEYPEGKARFPVVLVTWEDAKRFADWLGKSLPSEAQWERIARGTDGRHYPWGNAFHTDSLGCPEGARGYREGGVCTGDETPCGARDCAGNVREWTSDWYDAEYYLWSSSRVKDPTGPRGGRERVVRGGSWREDLAIAGLTHRRSSLPPSRRAIDLGFRLVIADSLYPDELRQSAQTPASGTGSTGVDTLSPVHGAESDDEPLGQD